MATGDKIVTLDALKAVYDSQDTDTIKSDLSDLNSALKDFSGIMPIEMLGTNKYIKTNVEVGATVSYTLQTSNGFKYAIVSCQANDAFTINVTGGNAPRAWAFVDSQDKLITKALNGVTETNKILIAPPNAAKLILNDSSGSTSYVGANKIVVLDNEKVDETELGNVLNLCENNIIPGWAVYVGRYLSKNDGANVVNSSYSRFTYLHDRNGAVAYRFDNSSYRFWLSYYNATGATDGTGYLGRSEDVTGTITIPETALKIGVSFIRVDGAAMTDSDAAVIEAGFKVLTPTDKTLAKENVPADAKRAGDIIQYSTEGWIDHNADPFQKGYNAVITPRLYNGEVDDSTGAVTADDSSNYVYTDLFTIEDVAFFECIKTGISWRLFSYNKSTGDFVSATSWSGQVYDREVVLTDTYLYRCAFKGDNMASSPAESLRFVMEAVRIYSGDTGVEPYLRSEYVATEQAVQALLDNHDGNFAFGFMTDLHFPNKFSAYYETSRKAIIHTFDVFERLSKEMPISAAVLGGDYMYFPTIENGMTFQDGVNNLCDVNRWLSNVDSPIRFALAGNHEAGYRTGETADGETDYGLSAAQIRAWLYNKYSQMVVKASDTVWYAIDSVNEVVWVFIGNMIAEWTSDEENGIDAVIAANTSNYPLICFNHYGVSGSTGEVWSKVDDALDYIVTTKSQTVIAWIGGHSHADWCAVYNNTLVISTNQSSVYNSNESQDGETYSHTIGSASESALSIFTVDKTAGKLYLTRFGAGVDHEYNYNTTSGTVGEVTN